MKKDNEKALVLTKRKIKKFTIADIVNLGYFLTDRQIGLGDTPYRYFIIELQDEDRTSREIEFCYLYSVLDCEGVIMPNNFDYYLTNPIY